MTETVERNTDDGTAPSPWSACTLGELADFSKEKATPENISDDMLYIGLEHIEKGTGELVGNGNAAEVRSTKGRFRKGALLYGKLRPYLNKVHVAKSDGICSTDILIMEPRAGVSAEFLKYRMLSEDFVRYANRNVNGVQHPRVNKNTVSLFGVELPPLAEQRRIVEKIEELFTRLDAGVASLEKTKALLKKYRQSVLKAAVTGELSREWRDDNDGGELEPAADLLKRILEERREKWSGKKYKEPVAPDTSNLPALPEGWEWARAEQVCGFITKGTTPKADKLGKVGDVPFIKVYNLTHSGTLDFSINPTFVAEETHEGFLARSKVYPNDVLMNIVGPPLGKVSIVSDSFPEWNINQAIAIFRSLPSYDTKFLTYTLLTTHILDWATRRAKATAGQFNLTLAICRDLPLPIPSLEEQIYIVGEVERRLSVVEKLEATIEENMRRSGSLRQSILKRAFSGRLVGQNAEDEPAGVLLERIRDERAEESGRSGGKRGGKRKGAGSDSLSLFSDSEEAL